MGHVPKSPSYREVEFEGLLRSNGSSTKVLSLKTPHTPERLPAGYSSIMTSPVSTHASPTQGKLPSFLSPFPRSETPVPRSQSRASEHESIATIPAAQNSASPSTPASSNPNRKSSRFRLPVSPSNSRTAGLPPAEYDTVDFEARLASFDDDDLALPSRSKHSRRQSKDDAWVDILVANNNRRIVGQDVDRRNGLKSGRSDPELASQELSEVMASVHQVQSDDEEEDMEPVSTIEHHLDDTASATTSKLGTDVDQLTIPGPSTSTYDLDSVEDDCVPPPMPKKRLGYFDLHPERRTPKLGGLSVEDFRAESPAIPAAPFEDARLHFERQSMYEDPRAVFERPSLDSQGDASQEEHSELPYDEPEPPAAISTPPTVISPPPRDDSRRNTASPNPRVDISPPPIELEPVKPLNIIPKTQSKTASLIEMYREKERGGSPSPSPILPASKLPVRTGASLPASPYPPRPVSPAPATSASPSDPAPASSSSALTPAPAPAPAPVQAPVTVPIPAPAPALASTSISLSTPPSTPPRQSDSKLYEDELDVSPLAVPSRYVHGAPLHNVLEEDEEEEEE